MSSPQGRLRLSGQKLRQRQSAKSKNTGLDEITARPAFAIGGASSGHSEHGNESVEAFRQKLLHSSQPIVVGNDYGQENAL